MLVAPNCTIKYSPTSNTFEEVLNSKLLSQKLEYDVKLLDVIRNTQFIRLFMFLGLLKFLNSDTE